MSNSRRTTVFKGAILSVGMRWTDRFVGLASTLVLARVLMPADFGLVAMAMVVVGMVDVFLDLGVGAALIQNRAAEREHFDTAWTLRLCQSFVVAGSIALVAPLVARYYSDIRVVDILRVVAASLFIAGFENIGVIRFQKDMEFGRDFQFFFLKRIIATAITLVLAFSLRSYWALVIGSFAGRVVGVILSYALHPYRPRFLLTRWREIWSFSQWNLVSGMATYMAMRLDQLVIGRRENPAVVGAYSIGDEIASMPTTEILAPLGRVLFPAFVEARSQSDELSRVVLLAFGIQALIGLPAGFGVALSAKELVPILLGPQWSAAIPFVEVLGLVAAATAMTHSFYYALLAMGHVRTIAVYSLFRFVALMLLIMVAFPSAGALAIAELRLAVTVVALFVMLACVRSCLPELSLRRVAAHLWRAAVASVLMVGIVVAAARPMAGLPLVLVLGGKVFAGVIGYGSIVLLLWLFAGKPDGAERYVLDKMCPSRFARLRFLG